MYWPQIILVGLLLVELGMALAKHGEPRESNFSVWNSLISDAIILGLLWWGGFWA